MSKCKELLEKLNKISEPASVINSLAKKSGKSPQEVEGMWGKIKKSLKDQGHKETDDNFYALLVGSIKKALKLT